MGPDTNDANDRTTAGQLALEVIHEIKNPLEALGHLTYLALAEADEPEKVRQYMRLAEEQMSSLNHIIRQTLSLARTTHQPHPTNLADLAEAALRLHSRRITAKNIRLFKRIPTDLIAEIHAGEILQVLSNLIINALDALPDEGTLHLRFYRYDGAIHLTIADNGPGIPSEHLQKIFEPFFTTKEERGNGLGLALSRRIVDRHHGCIYVRSCVRTGRTGTTFKIALPQPQAA